ncbi:MAG: PA2779 family protein, partial [Cytophagales bacterium]|nr:PA2779 family protein [Rhizobacter sp.]
MTRPRRFIAVAVATSISFAGFVQTAQAGGLISTEQVAVAEGLRTAADHRAQVLAALERADVSAALVERGVSLDQARLRVAALTDAEAARLAAEIDRA